MLFTGAPRTASCLVSGLDYEDIYYHLLFQSESAAKARFFQNIIEHIKWNSAPVQAWTYAIEQSCLNKAAVVAADEREGGVRATLNLGHTFGHAIETGQGYGEICCFQPIGTVGLDSRFLNTTQASHGQAAVCEYWVCVSIPTFWR